jgi:hypothetical protein
MNHGYRKTGFLTTDFTDTTDKEIESRIYPLFSAHLELIFSEFLLPHQVMAIHGDCPLCGQRLGLHREPE